MPYILYINYKYVVHLLLYEIECIQIYTVYLQVSKCLGLSSLEQQKMCVLLFKGRSHFLDTITTPFHFLYISHFPFFVGQPHMLLLPQIHPCQCVLRSIKFMGLMYVLVSVIWQYKREYLDIVIYQSKQCDHKMSHKP